MARLTQHTAGETVDRVLSRVHQQNKICKFHIMQQLTLKTLQVPVDDFQYLTRIHYKSENVPADGKWGEHEIDYILFIQCNVTVAPNENEVKAHRYVSREQLKEIMSM